ncbi:MAG: glycosyltransferase family 4 protein [Lachnospiraceae bacterium]|nr:glycosyltransferase family 4 protein [Lachnospiraceae bacterium]
MNILLMVSWYSPQGEMLTGGRFHYELAEELKKHCNCAIYYPYDRNIKEPYTAEREWGIMTYRSQYELKRKIRNRRYMLSAMRRIVKEFKPDIIHGQVATEAGRFAVMLGQIFHIPVIISEHSTVQASGVQAFPHYYYAKRVYAHSCYNTCVSESLTEDLSKIFPQFQFHTVYNGIKKLKVKKTENIYRREDTVNMVMVAGLYDRYIKGLQFVLPVLQRLLEEGYSVVLHFVGDGEYRQEYENVASELGIRDNCVFHGYCERQKVYDIVNEMDFFVCASIFESFSCATAEAMMCGKPVVATRCGGPDSIITKDVGILVEKESEQALYEGIVKMVKTYQEYSTKTISEYAYSNFSVENVCRQYLDIYQRVLR